MAKLTKCILIIFFCALYFSGFAQNVGINTTGTTPSANAILDLNTGNSRNLGFILPHVKLTSLTSFNPPIANANTTSDTGMMVYNTNAAVGNGAGCYCWNGAKWIFAGGLKANYGTTILSAITGTTSTTGLMMGLAGSITPTSSGTILITISGTISNSKNGDASKVQLYTGTGAAPGNGVALTGTAQGTQETATIPATNGDEPFCVNALVTGLTLNTAYWIDLGVASSAASGTASVSKVAIVAVEQ